MQPYVGQATRVRMSPLTSAVAKNKADALGVGNTGVVSSKGGTTSSSSGTRQGDLQTQGTQPSEEEIIAAKQAAAQGDQGAIDWLKTLGLVGGVVTAGGLTVALANRTKTVQGVPVDQPALPSAKGYPQTPDVIVPSTAIVTPVPKPTLALPAPARPVPSTPEMGGVVEQQATTAKALEAALRAAKIAGRRVR